VLALGGADLSAATSPAGTTFTVAFGGQTQ